MHDVIRCGSASSRSLSGMPFTPKRLGSVAYSLVMFVIVSVLAGVLVAGLFIPFAGLAGVSSKAAAAELEQPAGRAGDAGTADPVARC